MRSRYWLCALAMGSSIAFASDVTSADEPRFGPSQAEFQRIVVDVLGQLQFEGFPPPPPPPPKPGQPDKPRQPQKPPSYVDIVLVDETVAICSASASTECVAIEDAKLFLSHALDHRVSRSLRQQLVAVNKASIHVECPHLKKVRCASSSTIASVFKAGGWQDGFYRKYPGTAGMIRFSNAAISPDGDRALLYIASWCGGLCGNGSLVVLHKANDHWVIKQWEKL